MGLNFKKYSNVAKLQSAKDAIMYCSLDYIVQCKRFLPSGFFNSIFAEHTKKGEGNVTLQSIFGMSVLAMKYDFSILVFYYFYFLFILGFYYYNNIIILLDMIIILTLILGTDARL